MKFSDPVILKLIGGWKRYSDTALVRQKKTTLVELLRNLENNYIEVLKNNERQYRILMEVTKDISSKDFNALVEKINKETFEIPPVNPIIRGNG